MDQRIFVRSAAPLLPLNGLVKTSLTHGRSTSLKRVSVRRRADFRYAERWPRNSARVSSEGADSRPFVGAYRLNRQARVADENHLGKPAIGLDRLQ